MSAIKGKVHGVAHTKRGVAVGLLVCAVFATIGALLVTDPTGAHLELAPLFVGAALALASVRAFRSRSRRNRG